MSNEHKLAIVAGETSGDLIAAPVLKALNARIGGLNAFGIGGPAMQSQGLEALWTIDALSVRGYSEVIGSLPRLLSLRRSLGNEIIARRPGAFVGVDAPDFNLTLARRLRGKGIRTLHFIGPSVWAWRRSRLKRIARSVDHMLLVFPFEKKLYDAAGINATYVGHPMADEIDPSRIKIAGARSALGLSMEQPVVAILPGSRAGEIRYMGELFLKTAAWMHDRQPGLQFVVPAANESLGETLRQMMDRANLPSQISLTVLDGRARMALAAADTALVASGTATLETALMQRPMVIAYRMARGSYQIMRRMGYLPYVGLPNILCDDWVVPEFIQDAATPAAMGDALLNQLNSESQRRRIADRFSELHDALSNNCAQRAAEVIADYVSE